MASVTRTKTWNTGDTLTAADLNTEFNNLLNSTGIVNADIAAGAAIATSKINATFPTGTIVGTSDTQTLTNKTLTSPTITAPTITNTGTITLPTATTTLVGTDTTDTLSNKTLTKPTINGSVGAYTSDTDGATITFNMTASNVHTVTLGGNRTLAVSNTSTGQPFVIRLVQDGTGSRTVTWFSTIKWPNGTAPTLSTAANRVDVFGFITTGSNTYDGFTVGLNLS